MTQDIRLIASAIRRISGHLLAWGFIIILGIYAVEDGLRQNWYYLFLSL